MSWNRAIRLLLLASCLASPGCARIPRPPLNGGQAGRETPATSDEEHAELERELSLYSD
jgi:hypothetical protein